MTSSSLELQKSIHLALSADAGVTALLGGAKVYDDIPRAVEPPYLAIGESSVRDWSTGSEPGEEHVLTLHVWSRAAGKKETYEILHAVRQALHDAALAVSGHRLVNLRHEFTDARREPDGETYHGLVRYRAVTEPV